MCLIKRSLYDCPLRLCYKSLTLRFIRSEHHCLYYRIVRFKWWPLGLFLFIDKLNLVTGRIQCSMSYFNNTTSINKLKRFIFQNNNTVKLLYSGTNVYVVERCSLHRDSTHIAYPNYIASKPAVKC